MTSHSGTRLWTAFRAGVALALASALGCYAAEAEQGPLPRFELKQLSENGGRLAWYAGASHELIAYDAVVDKRTGATEVFVMQPDGSNVRGVTGRMSFPKGGGFVGQPAWHPDGKHLVIQVENANSKHTRFNHMSWGVDADLWLIGLDGARAERIWRSDALHAALHPHFSADGRLLVFAERNPTRPVAAGPFHPWAALEGQNPWDGWAIHSAAVDSAATGEKVLTNHRRAAPNGSGFYETHSVSPEGRVVYSFTAGGAPYVDDIYESDTEGRGMRRLIESPATWDEHGSFSPNGRNLAFISSRADPEWRAPRSHADTLSTELFVRGADGRIHQVTEFNKGREEARRYLVSDFDWDRDGRRIAFQVAPIARDGKPETPQIWLLEFSAPLP